MGEVGTLICRPLHFFDFTPPQKKLGAMYVVFCWFCVILGKKKQFCHKTYTYTEHFPPKTNLSIPGFSKTPQLGTENTSAVGSKALPPKSQPR